MYRVDRAWAPAITKKNRIHLRKKSLFLSCRHRPRRVLAVGRRRSMRRRAIAPTIALWLVTRRTLICRVLTLASSLRQSSYKFRLTRSTTNRVSLLLVLLVILVPRENAMRNTSLILKAKITVRLRRTFVRVACSFRSLRSLATYPFPRS